MRKAFAMVLTLVFVTSALTSCDQFKKLGGDKAAEEKKKMEEMAAQIATKLAEDAKKAEEEKKKFQEQIDAEVTKRLAEKEAEMKKAAETQPVAPTTQPTTQKEEPVKVVERIIIKEKEPAKKPAPSERAEQIAQKLSGYVRLYDDAGFTDRILTVRFGRDIGNMHYVSSDDGKSGFNDKASSVKYSVPAGYQAVLYENNNYAKRGYVLKGTGSMADLGYFGDKCSSLRWEKAQ